MRGNPKISGQQCLRGFSYVTAIGSSEFSRIRLDSCRFPRTSKQKRSYIVVVLNPTTRRSVVGYRSIAIPVPQFSFRVASRIIPKHVCITTVPPPSTQLPVPSAVDSMDQFRPLHSQERIKILVPQVPLQNKSSNQHLIKTRAGTIRII